MKDNTAVLFTTFVAVLSLLLVLAGKSFADTEVLPPPKVIVQSPDTRPRSIIVIIKDHRFEPEQITLIPGEKVILHIVNKDDSVEEFESRYLKREKIIPAGGVVDIAVGPLKPGVYDFIGEYHADTCQGRVVVPQPGWNAYQQSR
ncbi:MAG: cupredoxin domain-containing protein [Proteobacteria bacterium]|nr:cupredoxin domain-containing protein [Pseudomonadota bacterium]